MKWIAAILIVQAFAATAQSPFCTQLESVTDQASDGFRNLRGALDDDTENYLSAYAFPGATSCQVSESPYTYEFRCNWRYGADEWDSALTDARSLAASVADCFDKRISDNGVEQDNEDDSIHWRGRLSWAADRWMMEIGADSFVSRTLKERRLISSSLTVRYTRQALRE